MGIPSLARHIISSPTWLICYLVVLAFIAGIVVDVDHALSILLGLNNARFLHLHFTIVGLVFIGIGTGILIALVCRLHR